MRVEVLERIPGGHVRVRSYYGTFVARWHGALPEAGSTQWVEVDVDDIVAAQHIVLHDEPVQKLADAGDRAEISGLVTEYGADDVLVVTLDGSPVMVDTSGDAPLGVVGRHVTVSVRDVTLFPYEL